LVDSSFLSEKILFHGFLVSVIGEKKSVII
jgi:hypothetical protein